jgi:superfamily II DNA or RNA helicase
VVDASSTLSVQKALQRWGRGSRPYRDYKDFVLLDFAGNYYQHGRYEADRTWNLNGEPLKTFNDGAPDYRIKTCPKCRHPFRLGPKACPRCGRPIPVKEREVREANGHLKLIDLEEEKQERRQEQKKESIEAWASRATDEEKLKKLEEWKAIAMARGYAKGWAWSTFARVFNGAPIPARRSSPPTPPEIREALNKWETLS